jgi:preprotein translocase subunit YajC
MNSAVLNVLAAAAADQAPAWMQFLPFVAIIAVFWFLVMRPQMRQQKEQRQKIQQIKKGDQVLTGGGFLGKVISVDENYANIEIAPNVRVKTVKSTITDVVDSKSPPAND